MKNLLKITLLLSLIAMLFYGCSEDVYENTHTESTIKHSKISLQKAKNEIKNLKVNQFIDRYSIPISYRNTVTKSIDLDTISLDKFIKDNQYILYSKEIHPYTQIEPYIIKTVVQVQISDATIKAGYFKFIPKSIDDAQMNLPLNGELQMLNINQEITAKSSYTNGVLDTQQTSSTNRLNCYDKLIFIPHSCTHGGNHMPWEHCGGGSGENSYWEIQIEEVCQTIPSGLDIESPSFMVDLSPNQSGGGGPAINTTQSIVNQIKILMPTLSIQEESYLNQNPDVASSVLGYLQTNSTIESQQFVNEFIIQCINNPNLHLDFEASLKSPMNIDLSSMQDNSPEAMRFRCIYNKLLECPTFKKLFVDTFGNNTRLNAKFVVSTDLPVNTSGRCEITGTNGVYTNIIKLNSDLLANVDGIGVKSNFEVAKTILHECIHAYLNIKKINCNNGTTLPYLNNLRLDELINTFYSNFNCHIDVNGSQQSQHDFIYNYMIPTFQDVFEEIRDKILPPSHIQYAEQTVFTNSTLSITEQWNWYSFYKYFSLSGLHNCDSFIETTANNPTQNFLYNAYNNSANSLSKTCN